MCRHSFTEPLVPSFHQHFCMATHFRRKQAIFCLYVVSYALKTSVILVHTQIVVYLWTYLEWFYLSSTTAVHIYTGTF